MEPERFSEEAIIAILKEQDAGVPIAEQCRKHGMSGSSLYGWQSKYGGLEVSDAKKLKGLETENARLKRLLADAMLDNAALKDLLGKMVTPAARREAVAHLETTHGMSERRACRVMDVDRSSVRYRATRPDDAECVLG